jgi:2'-5' RNA ligase
VFLALPLPEVARRELAQCCAPLAADSGSLRPVAPDGYHITVHFFGSLVPGDVARARQLCRHDTLAAMAALPGRLTSLGQLPPRGPARVVHAVLGEGSVAVTDFLVRMRGLVAAAGFPVERRPPLPHVTVARVRRGRDWRRRSALAWSGAPFLFDRLVLFESHLGGTGARYEPLATRRLGTP